jgi:CBS domain-containing protein
VKENTKATTQFSDDDLLAASIDQRDGQHSISNLLSTSIVYVDSAASVRDVAVKLRSADVSLAVVGDDQHVLGVISERDVVRAVALDIDLDTTLADAIETDDIKWATVDSSVDDVAEEMLENYLRHVLIGNDDGALVGVVSMRDLLAVYLV